MSLTTVFKRISNITTATIGVIAIACSGKPSGDTCSLDGAAGAETSTNCGIGGTSALGSTVQVEASSGVALGNAGGTSASSGDPSNMGGAMAGAGNAGVGGATSATSGASSILASSGGEASTLASPGGASSTTTLAILGVDGGVVTSADGQLTLVLPPHALAAPTTITIAPAVGAPAGALGPAYEIGPTGTQFQGPVKLVFQRRPEYGSGDIAVGTVQSDAWVPLAQFVSDNNFVLGLTNHLSLYAVVSRSLDCDDNHSCPAPYQCVTGHCIIPCSNNDDCPSYFSCQCHECRSQACSVDDDCASIAHRGSLAREAKCNDFNADLVLSVVNGGAPVPGICTTMTSDWHSDDSGVGAPDDLSGFFAQQCIANIHGGRDSLCPADTSESCYTCVVPMCADNCPNPDGTGSDPRFDCAYGHCMPKPRHEGGTLASGCDCANPDCPCGETAVDTCTNGYSHFHVSMPGVQVTIPCEQLDHDFTSAAGTYGAVGGVSASTGQSFNVVVPTSGEQLRVSSAPSSNAIADWAASSFSSTNSGVNKFKLALALLDSNGNRFYSCTPGQCDVPATDSSYSHHIYEVRLVSSSAGVATFRVSGTFKARVRSVTLTPQTFQDAVGDWSLLVTVKDSGALATAIVAEDGWVGEGTNTVGVVGPWYTFADPLSTIQPLPNLTDFAGAGVHICTQGQAASVDPTTDWGAMISLDLNNPTGTVNAYVPSLHNVVGFGFGISGTAVPPLMQINYLELGTEAEYCINLAYPSGSNVIKFSDATRDCWTTGGAAASVLGSYRTLQFQVPGTANMSFNFCVDNLYALVSQ